MNVEADPDANGGEREHGHGVEYEPPLNGIPFAEYGVEQRGNTLEEKYNEYPYINQTDKVSADRRVRGCCDLGVP